MPEREVDILNITFEKENLFNEKDTYSYLHREMFGRHISFLGFHLRIRRLTIDLQTDQNLDTDDTAV